MYNILSLHIGPGVYGRLRNNWVGDISTLKRCMTDSDHNKSKIFEIMYLPTLFTQ